MVQALGTEQEVRYKVELLELQSRQLACQGNRRTVQYIRTSLQAGTCDLETLRIMIDLMRVAAPPEGGRPCTWKSVTNCLRDLLVLRVITTEGTYDVDQIDAALGRLYGLERWQSSSSFLRARTRKAMSHVIPEGWADRRPRPSRIRAAVTGRLRRDAARSTQSRAASSNENPAASDRTANAADCSDGLAPPPEIEQELAQERPVMYANPSAVPGTFEPSTPEEVRAFPFTAEQEWRRVRAVDRIKSCAVMQYQALRYYCQASGEVFPPLPDPLDRDFSASQWDEAMFEWRASLRGRHFLRELQGCGCASPIPVLLVDHLPPSYSLSSRTKFSRPSPRWLATGSSTWDRAASYQHYLSLLDRLADLQFKVWWWQHGPGGQGRSDQSIEQASVAGKMFWEIEGHLRWYGTWLLSPSEVEREIHQRLSARR